jgi:hypothetical protein
MTPHDWFVEHRAAYATRLLDPADERAFDEHLRGCEECRTAVATVERELAWLPMGAVPAPLRPGLARRIFDDIVEPRRTRLIRRAAPWAIAASLLFAAASWTLSREQVGRLAATLAARDRRLAALTDTLSIMRQASRVLQTSITMDGHQGGMMIFADEKTHRWNVVVHGLPPAPKGEMYQFWFVAEDGMVRGVQLDLRNSHPAFFTVGMPSTGGRVMGAALSVEDVSAPGTAGPGRMLAHLML